MPPADHDVPDSLTRAVGRRDTTLSFVGGVTASALSRVWRDAPPDTRTEIASALVELAATAKRLALMAGTGPVPLPPPRGPGTGTAAPGQPAANGNGGGRRPSLGGQPRPFSPPACLLAGGTYWERWSAVAFLTTLMEPGDQGSIVVKPRPSWMASAACSRAGTADWFPGKGRAPTTARAVCQSCPVQTECLDYALDDENLAGVWGGTTARERKAMRASGRVA